MNITRSRIVNSATGWRALVSATLLMVTGFGFFQLAAAADESEDAKSIRIRENDSSLQVSFEPVKSTFRVGEPLRFTIRGNKRFFLYLYNIDSKTDRAVLLLPNRRHKGNQYEVGRAYRVPNPTVEFYADKEGREKIVMVASTRYIDVDTAKFNKAGDFFSTMTNEIEELFETKGIRIRDRRSQRQGNTVVQEMEIPIEGYLGYKRVPDTGSDGMDTEDRAIVFVSTGKEHYVIGEKVQIIFGADQKGWVHLYTIEPDGSRAFLTKEQVSDQQVQRASARAEYPAGKHALIAVYTKDQYFDETRFPQNQDDWRGKGLRLTGEDSPSFAVSSFSIED